MITGKMVLSDGMRRGSPLLIDTYGVRDQHNMRFNEFIGNKEYVITE
jgi:hypothetical protein